MFVAACVFIVAYLYFLTQNKLLIYVNCICRCEYYFIALLNKQFSAVVLFKDFRLLLQARFIFSFLSVYEYGY